jgi:hypothetical protein
VFEPSSEPCLKHLVGIWVGGWVGVGISIASKCLEIGSIFAAYDKSLYGHIRAELKVSVLMNFLR